MLKWLRFLCGTTFVFFWAASKQPLKLYLPKTVPLKPYLSKYCNYFLVLGVWLMGAVFEAPRRTKTDGSKNVPQKLPPLYKTFDRFTLPNKQTIVGKWYQTIGDPVPMTKSVITLHYRKIFGHLSKSMTNFLYLTLLLRLVNIKILFCHVDLFFVGVDSIRLYILFMPVHPM